MRSLHPVLTFEHASDRRTAFLGARDGGAAAIDGRRGYRAARAVRARVKSGKRSSGR
jgi:hypothetical protein